MSHSKDGHGDEVGGDIDSPLHSEAPDAGAEDTGPKAPVTFILKNSRSEELFINMDKGWYGVFSSYSGEPPNAKQLVLFPPHCTASCDSAPEDMCPVCEEPTKVEDIKAAEKHDPIAPGQTMAVPWQGSAHDTKRAKGTGEGGRAVRCRCFETIEPEAGEYTVQACGIRKTQTAKRSSEYQCVKAKMTWPVEEPIEVVFDFGK